MVLIRKVWLAKATKQKMVTIPRTSDIQEGDYVLIQKMKVEVDYDQENTSIKD